MNPQAQFEHIVTLIADREQRNYPTFYTIKIEKFGKLSPIVDRETGEKNFSNTIFKCLSTYQPSMIQVDLYTGKSRKIHDPFQSFKIVLQRPSGEVVLSGMNDKTEFTQGENVIPVERFYDAKFEMQSRLMRMEFDNQRLTDTIEKLNAIIAEQKEAIEELETEIEDTAKNQKDSFANISLGHIGSIALEKFTKSEAGISILKGILGATDDQLKGLTGGNEIKEAAKEEAKSTASIVTKPQAQQQAQQAPLTQEQQLRKKVIDNLTAHFEKADNITLRLYYDAISLIAGDKDKLQKVMQLLSVMQQKQKEETGSGNVINLSTNQTKDSGANEEEDPDDTS